MRKEIKKLRITEYILLIMIIALSTFICFYREESYSKVATIARKIYLSTVDVSNMELSTILIDTTNGNTQYTDEYTWDATKANDIRSFIYQINYKKTDASVTYSAGDLEIVIPDLLRQVEKLYTSNYGTTFAISADSYSSSSKSYTFSYRLINDTIVLTNNNDIEPNTNFEGTIQISYTLYPQMCKNGTDLDITSKLNDSIESNTINFSFTSNKAPYTLSNYVRKVSSLDGFPSGNYTWVKVSTENSYNLTKGVRKIYHKMSLYSEYNPYYKITVPEGVLLLDSSMRTVSSEDNTYIRYERNSARCGGYYLPYSSRDNECTNVSDTEYYLGIPNDLYYDETIDVITELYGVYSEYNEGNYITTPNEGIELAAQNTAKIKASNYKFEYTGNLYKIEESSVDYNFLMDKVKKTGEDYNKYVLDVETKYVGLSYDIKTGTDLTYYNDNSISRLSDDDYYIDNIRLPYNSSRDSCSSVITMINESCFRNGNKQGVDSSKYKKELWVRYANEDNYELYNEFEYNTTFNDFDKKVVGFYFVIYGLNESLTMNPTFNIHITNSELANDSTITNLSFLDVYIDDELQNEPGASSYATDITRDYVLTYDQSTYGHLKQRAFKNKNVVNGKTFVKSSTTMDNISTNSDGIKYSNIHVAIDIGSPTDGYDGGTSFSGYEMYSLLPEGMYMPNDFSIDAHCYGASNLNSIVSYIKKSDGTPFSSYMEYLMYVDDHLSYEIINNWNDTNRTLFKLVVDYTDDPLDFSDIKYIYDTSYYDYTGKNIYEYFSYQVLIDPNYLTESSNTFRVENRITPINDKYTKSNWYVEKDTDDINEDGDTDEYLAVSGGSKTITTISESNEEILVLSSSDVSNFKSSFSKVKPGNDYKYRLRVRNAGSKITNLTIYDSIEKNIKINGEFVPVKEDDNYFKGTFKRIDLSYANTLTDVDGNPIKVKTYYSESETPGPLGSDDSWKAYSDSVDKTKVKSLAFDFVKASDQTVKAVLPANTLAYVDIVMTAPTDISIDKAVTYNGSWTEWNALDDLDNIVNNVTGVNSNVVSTSVPAKVTTRHLKYNTNEVLAPSRTSEYALGETYRTSQSSSVSNIYTFKETGGDEPTGLVNKFDTEVIYYYDDREPYDYISMYKYGSNSISSRTDQVYFYLSLYGYIYYYKGASQVKIVDHLPYKIDVSKSVLVDGVYNDEEQTITWIVDFNSDIMNETRFSKYLDVYVTFVDIPPSTEYIENTVEAELTYSDYTKHAQYSCRVHINEQYDLVVKHLEYGTNRELAEPDTNKYYGGNEYTTSEKEIEGYRLKIRPENYEGIIEKELTEVIYYYEDTNPKLSNSIDKKGEKYLYDDNELFESTITYQNVVRDYIGDVNTSIVDYLPYKIDEEKSDLDGGIYDEDNMTITWNDTYTLDSIDEIIKDYSYNIKLYYLDRDSDIVTNTVKGTTTITDITKTVETSHVTRKYGRITVKYIDINTNVEIADEEMGAGLLKTEFIPIPKEIEKYVLVETPEKIKYTYTSKPQILYMKYDKKIEKEPEKEESEIENPPTGRFNLILLLIPVIIVLSMIYMKEKNISIFRFK